MFEYNELIIYGLNKKLLKYFISNKQYKIQQTKIKSTIKVQFTVKI
jgi:hypothetical protein